ncbi:ABC transporter substrate-binding protein [Cognatishimia sp.]|uniref:ABC transporter substrate-binding protein n=1 Tax=Cognatishimia sp. TaxID=2211648 RepID=UPI003515AEB9
MKGTTKLFAAASLAAASIFAQPVLADGGSLTIATSQVPRHLNGAVQSGFATALPSTQIFASLLRYDNDWTPQPYLADSWSFSDDGLSLTVNLNADATFHDGAPVTSKDVAFSLLAIKENHPFKSMFAPVVAVDTPDDKTAVIRMDRAHPALLLALSPALSPILPAHVYDDGQDLKSHPANSAPVGSGPYMLDSFTAGESIVLKKNPNFFIDGRPKLDEIIVRIIKDASSLMITMENGDADMWPYIGGSQQVKRMEGVESLTVTSDGYAGIGPINWLAFNTKGEKTSDVRVRQAIAYAIDRNFITKALHRGTSAPQRGPIIETSPFFDSSIPAYDVDLDKAKALLAEAGYADGMDLAIDYIPAFKEQQQTVAEYLKSQLAKVGINVTLRASPDFPTWAGRINSYDFEATMDIVFNWGDPVIGVHRTYLSSNIVPGVIWSNTQQYENATVDSLLEQAAVEQDLAKRTALYAEFQQIVAQDLPVYWVNSLPFHTAYSDKLENPPVGIWGAMHPMDTIEWAE